MLRLETPSAFVSDIATIPMGRFAGEIIRQRQLMLREIIGAEIIRDFRRPVTAPMPAPAKRKRAAARRATTAKPTIGAEEFWTMHKRAVSAIGAVYGDRWAVAAPRGETVLAHLPAKLRSYIGPRGGKIRWEADHRMPAAKYWPGGALPDGLTFAEDPARETRGREWGGDGQPDYAAWLAAWAARNGLVGRKGIYRTAEEWAELDAKQEAQQAKAEAERRESHLRRVILSAQCAHNSACRAAFGHATGTYYGRADKPDMKAAMECLERARDIRLKLAKELQEARRPLPDAEPEIDPECLEAAD